jgi:general secretion pathway protein D
VLPGQAATGSVPTTSTVTSIEFKDTGVKLTVEPTIHHAQELTLKLKVEVTRLGDLVTLQSSPEIKQFRFGTRAAETILNMKSDEAVVLAGLIQDDDRKTRVSLPGLGDVPVLGHIFSSKKDDATQTEVIVTITPHVVRPLSMPELDAQAVWSGTELTYATHPLFSVSAATDEQTGGRESSIGRPSWGSTKMTPMAADAPWTLEPAQVGTRVGQEFRVALTARNAKEAGGTIATIAYDAQKLEVIRTEGAVSETTTTVLPGAVTFSFPADLKLHDDGVLVSVVFRASAAGEFPVALAGAATDPIPVRGDPVMVHVINDR